MKLSEVIKAIEDGSENKFVCEEFEILKSGENVLICFDKKPMVYVNVSRNFEEVKPPRQWSENELTLFKLFPWANWIVKTKFNEIILSENKLSKIGGNFVIGQKVKYMAMSYTEFLFDDLEKESPAYIGDLKGE